MYYRLVPQITVNEQIYKSLLGCISLLLPEFVKLPSPFAKRWLGNLGSSKETQPKSACTNRQGPELPYYHTFWHMRL